MKKVLPSRARATLVLTAAGAVLVSTTSFAAAQQSGDASTVRVCVTKGDGQLRLLVDASQACRASESAMTWNVAGDSGEAVRAFREELRADDLQGAGAPNDGDGSVHWDHLEQVPASVLGTRDVLDDLVLALSQPKEATADGLVHWTNLLGVRVGSEHLETGSVDTRAVRDGSIITADLAERAIVSSHIAPGTVLTNHLAGSHSPYVAGAVTSEKILDGTIETNDLRSGAVTADKLALPAASSADAHSFLLTGGTSAPDGVLQTLPVASADRVLATGQAQVSCVCTEAGDSALVQYQLVRTSNPGTGSEAHHPASPVYSVIVRNGHNTVPVSVTALDVVPAGQVVYRLRFVSAPATGTSAPGTSNAVVNAVVIGGA